MGLMKCTKILGWKLSDNLLAVSSKSVEFEILSDRPTILDLIY